MTEMKGINEGVTPDGRQLYDSSPNEDTKVSETS